MSRTLNLVRRLLATGRKLHNLGVTAEASRILGRLSSLRELPAEVAEEVQRRLGQLLLKHGRYPRARRHFAALLAAHPEEPRYHRLMARALEKDDRCDPRRALEHYRRAVELAPDRPRYWSAFGLAAVRHGKPREGLAALRRAVELAPDDPVVVAKAVEGLGQRRRYDEAERIVRAALFRNPREGRFRKMWSELRFHRLRAKQLAARRRNLAKLLTDGGPTLLPFAPPEDRLTSEEPRTFRLDSADILPSPHSTRPSRQADQRHG